MDAVAHYGNFHLNPAYKLIANNSVAAFFTRRFGRDSCHSGYTVKYDLHIKPLTDLPRHQIPISSLHSGSSCLPPSWRMLLIADYFLCLYSTPFSRHYECVCMQNGMLDGFIGSVTQTSVLCSQRGNSRKVVNCGGTGICHIRLHVGCMCWLYSCSCTKRKKSTWALVNRLISAGLSVGVNLLLSGTLHCSFVLPVHLAMHYL